MIMPRHLWIGILLVMTVGQLGCVLDGIPEEHQQSIAQQGADIQMADFRFVPQTLEPATKSQESQPPNLKPSETPVPPQPTQIEDSIPQQPEASATARTNSIRSQNAASKPVGMIFGEYAGVKTKWEEMKQQLTTQLREQQQKTNELTVKLQLIEQIAEHVNFTTKAYVNQHNTFLAEFTIDNATSYPIKDISITCDQIAPTGTIIRSHAETIYDIMQPTTRSRYAPLPFGPKHPQTQALQCQITNFTVHNAS